jgi:hypothetical protein
MKFHLLKALLMVLVPVMAHAQTVSRLHFEPGQMWSIRSTDANPTKILIGRIEAWHHEIIVHISVLDVPVPDQLDVAEPTLNVSHMPIEEGSLERSVDRLLTTGVPVSQEFEQGYRQWKSDPRAGVYTTDVPHALQMMFDTLSMTNAKKQK